MSTSSRQRQWQLQWHEILNDYPDPDGGDSVTPEPLPELDTDFRLQFNLWQLQREARQRAFAILPCGAEMLARIDECLSARPEPLEPQQATTLLRTGLKRAREAGVQDVPSWEMHIDIVEMDTPLAQVSTLATHWTRSGTICPSVPGLITERSAGTHTSSCASRSTVSAATMRWQIGWSGRCAALLATPI